MQRASASKGERHVFLRRDLLRAGDVLLVRNAGRQAAAIGLAHPSGYSHAGIFVDRERCFEADGHGVGLARTAVCGGGAGGGMIVLPETKSAAVYRHPALAERLVSETFESDLTIGLEAIVGRKVQPYSRLGRLSRASGTLEPAAEVVLNAMDLLEVIKQDRSSSRRLRDEGRFCSEIVTEVLAELGTHPFADQREPALVGPGHLSESVLVNIAGAAVSGTVDEIGVREEEVREAIAQYQRARELVGLEVGWSLIQRRDEEAAEVKFGAAEEGDEGRVERLSAKVRRCRDVLEELEAEARVLELDRHARVARRLREATESALERAGDRAEVVRAVADFVMEFDVLKGRAMVSALRRAGKEQAAASVRRRVERLQRLLEGRAEAAFPD